VRNVQARRFYERKGFKIVERGRDSDQSEWFRMSR
jgi:hypothetical protein